MNVRKWFKDYRGLLLVTLILIVSSPVFTEIIPNPHFSNWNKGILTTGVVILAVVAAKGDAARLAAERNIQNTRTRWDQEQAAKYRQLNGKALLLQRVSEELGEAIAETRDTIGALDLDRSTETKAAARRHCIKASLKSLCKVLEAGSLPREREPLQAIIFKATLFEISTDNDGNGQLERRYWHYPATIQPRTSKWDLVNDSNATAVQAYLRRQEVILESVKKAAKSGDTWKDSRPGHHREYEKSSMICVPVWAETNAADPENSTVRAIVTVDTNQVHFFRDGEDERAFRAQVFGPFMSLIRLIYKLTE